MILAEALQTSSRGELFVEFTKSLATAIAALAWPLIVTLLVWPNRRELRDLLSAVVDKVGSAKSINIAKLIELEVSTAAEQAQRAQPSAEIPKSEIMAATKIHANAGFELLALIRQQLISYAQEYEATRAR